MSDAVGGRVGTVIKGKWHVDARIGSGGMATVYAATHRNGHRAALKMLHAQLSRDAAVRARFLREAYVANTVTHPAVVRVDDDDVTDDGCVFLVMELLEGETLEARRLHNANGALPIGEVMEIGEQALDALAAAHEKGIIHRDVKPENVFVTKAGRVKLLDFGLARMKDLQGESTKTGVTIGTPEFMPPEQAMAKRGNVDARSDVWGMGATLFTALSGKYVHDASNLHQQLMAAATQRARSVRSVATHVPLAVGQVIDRALELDMNDRWPTAREMQRALRAARGAPAEASLESLTMQAALPADAPLPSEDVPFPISSDKTVAVSDVISSDKPTLQRPITLQDKTIALAAPTSSSPSTERIAQKETKRLDTTAKLAPTTPRMSGQSGENRALAGSGANPALGFSASGENPAHGFSASGENPALRQSPRMLAASGVSP
ncbi:MAG TPA: serine/threonine-protein kinase, partial [Labilithrix sp.]